MANNERLRIFLSHSSDDTRIAEETTLALLQEGHEVFFDHNSLNAGTSFHRAIREEVSEADLFLFFISPASLTEGRYTLTELELAKDQWPNPSGRVLPVMVSETDWDSIPPYLAAIKILKPKGNIAPEVVAEIEKLIGKGLLATGAKSNIGATKVQKETYYDSRVESVKKQLDELLSQNSDQKIFLRKNVFPILRELFARRNTFNEKVVDCEDEVWSIRLIAATETRRLMEAYRPAILKLAILGDERLVQSYDQLKLHLYLQKLTKLFSPSPRVDDITDRMKGGDFETVKEQLQNTEIHPKKEIDSKAIEECDEHQSVMKYIWEQWPII